MISEVDSTSRGSTPTAFAFTNAMDASPRSAGRRTTGLDSIAGRGHHVGMLYVTESNTAAMRLYESMGFRTHLVRQAFVEVQ
jgi:hypothetical protein